MSWNYRLIKTCTKFNGELIHSYAIHEVYYDADFNPNAWTKDAISLEGFEDFNDAYQSIELIRKAFEKPPLEIITLSNGNEDLKELSVFELSQPTN